MQCISTGDCRTADWLLASAQYSAIRSVKWFNHANYTIALGTTVSWFTRRITLHLFLASSCAMHTIKFRNEYVWTNGLVAYCYAIMYSIPYSVSGTRGIHVISMRENYVSLLFFFFNNYMRDSSNLFCQEVSFKSSNYILYWIFQVPLLLIYFHFWLERTSSNHICEQDTRNFHASSHS